MNLQKAAVCHAVALAVAGIFAGSSQVSAQTFNSYRCIDGTRFIVGFYPYDSRAYLQLDGRAVTLRKRLTLSGARYAGGGADQGWRRHHQAPQAACDRMRAELGMGRNLLVPTLLICCHLVCCRRI
jgi:membrane-bound inhibitor of C-type lysozyme